MVVRSFGSVARRCRNPAARLQWLAEIQWVTGLWGYAVHSCLSGEDDSVSRKLLHVMARARRETNTSSLAFSSIAAWSTTRTSNSALAHRTALQIALGRISLSPARKAPAWRRRFAPQSQFGRR
jgi:hypothetical protein